MVKMNCYRPTAQLPESENDGGLVRKARSAVIDATNPTYPETPVQVSSVVGSKQRLLMIGSTNHG